MAEEIPLAKAQRRLKPGPLPLDFAGGDNTKVPCGGIGPGLAAEETAALLQTTPAIITANQ